MTTSRITLIHENVSVSQQIYNWPHFTVAVLMLGKKENLTVCNNTV